MSWRSKNMFLSLIVGLVFSFETIGQLNQVDAQGRKQGEWVQHFDGSEFGHIVRYKGQFKNDKPIGKFVYYYPTRKVRAVITHEENSTRSEAYFYHDNESLAAYGIYRNGLKDSVWTNFLPSGHYSSSETFKNDVLHGEKIIYYGPEVAVNKQRIILRKDMYANGRLNGEFVEYFPDGVLKAKGKYKDGVLDEVVMRYHPNGRPMFEERWKYRKKHGLWKTFDEGGGEVGRKYFNHGVEIQENKLDAYLKRLKEQGKNPNE